MPDATEAKRLDPIRRLSPLQIGKLMVGSVLAVAGGALLLVVWDRPFLLDASLVGLNVVLFVVLHWHHQTRPGVPRLPAPPPQVVQQLASVSAAVTLSVREARKMVLLWATLPVMYGVIIYSIWHFEEASLWPHGVAWPVMVLVGLYGLITAFVRYIELRVLRDMLIGALMDVPGDGGEAE